VAEDATLLVAEWWVSSLLAPGTEAAESLLRAPVPVLLAHGDVSRFDRVVVIARPEDVNASDRRAVTLAAGLAPNLAGHKHGMAVVGPTRDGVQPLFDAKHKVEAIVAPDPLDWLGRSLGPGDLPLFAGVDAAREAIRRLPALMESRFLVAQPARAKPAQPRTEPVTSSVIAGRSLRPRPA